MGDYKQQMIELLNKIYDDNNAGVIPMVIGEALHEVAGIHHDGWAEYWVINNISKHILKEF